MQQPELEKSPKKKVLIETWGCQMNVADSENMLNMLQKKNHGIPCWQYCPTDLR